MEFFHEIGEGEFEEGITVDRDPVLDVAVTKSCQDLPHLLSRLDVSSIKITEASLFVFMHDRWVQIASA